MPPARALHVIFCWHMHQPDYRDADGQYLFPWTYLHACKDYADMVAHLEENPGARAVFNFVPVLIEQLEDYIGQFRSGRFRDRLLASLATPDLKTLSGSTRHYLLQQCFRLDPEHMMNPFPAYQRLHTLNQIIRQDDTEMTDYLSVQYLADLLVWYHLVWTGETVRRSSPLIQSLMQKGSGFTWEDRYNLLVFLGDLVGGILPRYRALAEEGRIEISTTPYEHPLAPLLLDFRSARDGVPDAPLPQCAQYPGGTDRVQWHLQRAISSHREHFGQTAAGLWPAEGGISPDFVKLVDQAGIRWTASGEGVLARSLARADSGIPVGANRSAYLYRPYRLAGQGPYIFFRDDSLSDRIGFDYKSWSGHDAATDFIQHLEAIWRQTDGQEHPVVSIILDGENAWEYYPYNGYYFLSELYRELSHHPHIRMCTFQNFVQEHPDGSRPLPELASGSWVYGSFSTWIGDPAKNRAWDALCSAKKMVDLHLQRFPVQEQERILEQLGLCEGSDWFWWFGDYNPADSVRDFDLLFRSNLRRLYQLLQVAPPENLGQPISQGTSHAESSGAMRRSHVQG